MARCRVHGTEFEPWEGCSDCRDAEERETQDRAELLGTVERIREERLDTVERIKEAAAASAYRSANPGDYRCPDCKYITLRREAKRCPKCHAQIDDLYWPPILRAEAAAAEAQERERRRAAEEWARGEPERQRKAMEEQAKLRAEAATAEATRRRAKFQKRYFGYLLPLIAFVSTAAYGAYTERALPPIWWWPESIVMGIPALNWVVYGSGLLAAGPMRIPMLFWLGLWATVGLALNRARRR